MKEIKDLFSAQSATYATYRPVYPDSLYDFIYDKCRHYHTAWDCGTGNGQVANRLAEKFDQVYATDISTDQIGNAIPKNNIAYIVCRAENTPLEANRIDLITVGTALHWFDFDNFYAEVKRVAKPGAFIAAWCYAPFRSIPEIDNILDHFYTHIVGDYWDAERKYVDEKYKTIPFPFEEIASPAINIQAHWTRDQFIGFLNSWSSVQHYIKKNGENPVDLIAPGIMKNWAEEEIKEIRFPLFMRTGYIW
jgi:SAM-dependent methyltransferase